MAPLTVDISRFRLIISRGGQYWETDAIPGHITVAVGAFADPVFPAPTYSGWEAQRHRWVDPLLAVAIHHSD